ncbi:DUF6894 family protein [Methylobacterium nigriterrae]|uniref:DUF6894 family protein n=1 Tax=Methylobacterium nigriterrae TaxID=3127512 RepID=UPI003014053D
MPCYYFHLRTAAGLQRDEEGLAFPSLEAAYLDVCRAVTTMGAELVQRGQNPTRHVFEITDAAGRLLMKVPFSEMLSKGERPQRPVSPALALRAQAEKARTRHLIARVQEEREALHATLSQTQKLLVRLRKVARQDVGRT